MAILFSIVGYIIDTEDVKAVSEYRVALNVLMTLNKFLIFIDGSAEK